MNDSNEVVSAADAVREAANVVVVSPPAVPVFSFAPRDLGEAMKLADMLSSSTMVPKDFRGNSGNCFLAMQWGAELDMKPLQAIQCIAVINGKPGIYGDAGKAMLLNKGCRIEELDVEEIRRTGIAQCTIQRAGRAPVTRTFSIEDAKLARLWQKDGPWTLYPYRQMAWRAFWFAARDAAADILRGMSGAEELRDIEAVEREVTGSATVVERVNKSKTERMAETLKRPKIDDVVKLFADAQDGEQLTAAIETAKKLGGTEDRKKAESAYKEALARLRGKAHPEKTAPPFTVGDVQAKLAAATSMEELDLARDLINGLDCEDDIKAALHADYKALSDKLVPMA